MASTYLIRQADQAFTASPASKWAAGALILGTISFNAALCFINTHGFGISDAIVMLSEALLIFGALLACRNHLDWLSLALLAGVVLYTLTLSAVRFTDTAASGLDLKTSRDLVIPVVFFLLGRAINDVWAADKIVLTATIILLGFAAFEYLFLDSFLKVFSIAEYYVARGTLTASEHSLDVSQGLMVSGFRPADQGRTLLPFLNDHRVSSLFLEPSTLGNFGMLVTLWAIVRSRMEARLYILTALGGLVLLILSDTRFDAYFLVLATMMSIFHARLTTPVVLVLPFIVMFALYFLAASADPYTGVPMVGGLGLYDRLLYSGRVLSFFNAYNWFGLETSQAQTFDSGYGYIIGAVGIIGFALLWTLFMSLRGASQGFYTFRNIVGVYFATLLCISASQFTIKLAATLWFLLGVLSLARDTRSRRSAAEKVMTATSGEAERIWWGSRSLSSASFSETCP